MNNAGIHLKKPIWEVTDEDWPRNGIDRFILRRLEREKLRPSAEASKEALIRRGLTDVRIEERPGQRELTGRVIARPLQVESM